MITGSNMPIHKLDDLLSHTSSADGAFQKLMRKADEKAYLKRILESSFPEDLTKGINSVTRKGSTLHIGCLNSSIATRIRFESDRLLLTLSTLQDFEKLAKIKTFVS